MRKKTRISVLLALMMVGICLLAACGGGTPSPSIKLYFSDSEFITTDVVYGEVLTVDIPIREGNKFLGYYSAESGGTRYIKETGESIAAWAETYPKTLYARFETLSYNVTLHAEGLEMPMVVEYGARLEDFTSSFQMDGKVATGWSLTQGGQPFTGEVTGDIHLYVIALAPYLTFDSNGGMNASRIVAQSGSLIMLPVPSRAGCMFAGWFDNSGAQFAESIMPDQSRHLKAKWHVVINLNANGGSGTMDSSITGEPGSPMTLPTLTKEGTTFAGWYNDFATISNTVFPQSGMTLTARFRTLVEETIYLAASGDYTTISSSYNSFTLGFTYSAGSRTFDEKENLDYLKNNPQTPVSVKFEYDYKGGMVLSTTTVKLFGSVNGDVIISHTHSPTDSYISKTYTAQTTGKIITGGDRIVAIYLDTNNYNSTVYLRNGKITISFTKQTLA